MAERRYNEKELAEILRRAGRRQFSRSADDSTSFSLADIQRLASEVGIEPALVAAEAASLPEREEEGAGFWGATPYLMRDVTVPGPISEETWEEIVAELRASLGGVGEVTSTELSREWDGGTDFRAALLAATRRGNETRLRLTFRQYGGLSLGWAFGFVFTFVFTMITFASLKHGLPVGVILAGMLAAVAFCLGVVNRLFARWQSKNRRLLDRTLERVQRIACLPASAGVAESLSRAAFEPEADEAPLRQIQTP